MVVPLPFLDPHGSGGYPSVAAYVIAIAVIVSLIAWGVVWVDRRRTRAHGPAGYAGPGGRR